MSSLVTDRALWPKITEDNVYSILLHTVNSSKLTSRMPSTRSTSTCVTATDADDNTQTAAMMRNRHLPAVNESGED
jgi:hypothetical protein